MQVKLKVTGDSLSSDELLEVVKNQQEELQSNLRDSGATLVTTKTGCVAFTLRFISTKDLALFKQNLDSGLLKRLIKDTLMTDDLNRKFKADEFTISLTIFDSWEYDMCQKELTSLEGRNHIFSIFRGGGSTISRMRRPMQHAKVAHGERASPGSATVSLDTTCIDAKKGQVAGIQTCRYELTSCFCFVSEAVKSEGNLTESETSTKVGGCSVCQYDTITDIVVDVQHIWPKFTTPPPPA